MGLKSRIVSGAIDRVAPNGSARRERIRTLLGRKDDHGAETTSIPYMQWIKDVEPDLWLPVTKSDTVKISVVVPTYNTPDKYIVPLVDSLKAQTYSNWQLCLADGSTDEVRAVAIRSLAGSDERIVYKHLKKNAGISSNTNEGLKLATGDFISLLDHDDILSPNALNEVACAIADTDADILYSDEDKLSDDGKYRQLPFFKPDWSPDLLLGVNYITHFLTVRSNLMRKVGPLRSEYDGAQDYDLLLRLTEASQNIHHIPKILYHWRLADGSTAKTVGEKNYADTAGQRALGDAVKRRGLKAKVVEIPERPTNYRLQYDLPKKQPLVSIIIPFKDKPELLKTCVESILNKTTYKNYELILVSNNSVESATTELLDALDADDRVKVFHWDHPFNYSKVNNFGVSKASGDYVVLLNNDTEIITASWLEELVGVASQEGVGTVGPMLHYPDESNGIQHAGVVLGMGTMAGHVFRHRQPSDWTDFGSPSWPRNYLATTAACVVVKKSLYERAGGLDETFTVAGQDVAFGIRLYEMGYRNIYWPFAELYHYESVSVGSYDTGIQLDYDHSLTYYRKYHEAGDPYFNPNLDLMNEQVGIRRVYEKTH